MADRKVYVRVVTNLIVRVDEGADINDVVNGLTYSFEDTTGKATVEDTSIEDFDITDSK